ncbi:MAG TPA: nucleotide sugar dehydrogenase [Caldilineaceae bacterium]|nr:nucleotide sugar dehydrogenase [Caldilineaceae bacterium]
MLETFARRQAHVAVVGLGYVGLPLALTFAEAGYHVTGIDLDPHRVEAINRGESYIEDIPSAELAAYVLGEPALALAGPTAGRSAPPDGAGPRGRLQATTDYSVLAGCDAVSICVPTPLNKTGDPDMSYILSAGEQIARYLHPGMVVVLESTTYPGTTTELLLPMLQRGAGGRLAVGQDFFLAFSPERVDPGRADWVTRNTPKVIGGVTPACLEVASAYYGQAIETLVPVSSSEAAEMVKLFENTFRAVNIGLANELLLMCDKLNLDAWEVLDAAATKPFGFMKFTPGPGLGGHCIPIDPHYLSWKLRSLEYNARFIELASEINTEMPRYWAQKVQDALNDQAKPVKGSRILILGIAYKKDVSDLRESPALDIMHLLEVKGAQVSYHDPHVPRFQHEGHVRVGVEDLDRALAEADCVIITTDHSAYDWSNIRAAARLIVDTRHVL